MDDDMASEKLNTVVDETTGKELVVLPAGTILSAPLRYVGAGEYIYGVPARDLNANEAALYAAQIAAALAATGRVLYTREEN